MPEPETIICLQSRSGDRDVLLGSAPARLLCAASFADVLDEATGSGYQRRLDIQHSLDFRRYIQGAGATTIPLTFNLRSPIGSGWSLDGDGLVRRLQLHPGHRPLAQVDCQHRLGHLADLNVTLSFMAFMGLSAREEMEIFGVINGKARGLPNSLLDFHAARLAMDLGQERPELLIALHLKNDPSSPWHQRLDLGGQSVSGLDRRASLRTMQKACRILVRRLRPRPAEEVALIALAFWRAVATVLPDAFAKPRTSLVTKGIGVYALSELAADMVLERHDARGNHYDGFIGKLADFAPSFDWTNTGLLAGLGGEGGARRAADILRQARRRTAVKVAHG